MRLIRQLAACSLFAFGAGLLGAIFMELRPVHGLLALLGIVMVALGWQLLNRDTAPRLFLQKRFWKRAGEDAL